MKVVTAMDSTIICITMGVVGLIAASCILIISCLIVKYRSRVKWNRFESAIHAYEDEFGIAKTITILHRLNSQGMDLNDIVTIMERAVKSRKQVKSNILSPENSVVEIVNDDPVGDETIFE